MKFSVQSSEASHGWELVSDDSWTTRAEAFAQVEATNYLLQILQNTWNNPHKTVTLGSDVEERLRTLGLIETPDQRIDRILASKDVDALIRLVEELR